MKARTIVLALGLVLAVAMPSVTVAGAIPRGKPAIRITSPAQGAVIHGSSVTVHVAVSNFKLVRPILLSPSKWGTIPLLKGNQGHIHYFLDSMATMVLTRDVTTMTSHTWTHVSPGRHTVTAYLATSQHAPFPGAKAAKVTFMVAPHGSAVRSGGAAPKPTIRIVGVRTHITRQGAVVSVRVVVNHFKLVSPVYVNPPKLQGDEGHIHYVLDGLSNFKASRDAVTALYHPWDHVKPGHHTLIAYLATSQHQPFPGAKPAAIQINVPAEAGGGTTVRINSSLPKTGGGDVAGGVPSIPAIGLVGLAGLAMSVLALGATMRRRGRSER